MNLPFTSRFGGRLLLIAFVPFFGALFAQATVTLEIYFEDGAIPDGALAAIVADTANDGFYPLTDPSVSGTVLSTGSTIGNSDDLIVGLFNSTSGPEWPSGAGFADTLASLDYSALGIFEGTQLAIYVFPTLFSPGSLFILGDEFILYRNTNTGGSGGDIPFTAPADPGVYIIAAYTTENGGNFDPANLEVGEIYDMGNAGATGGGETGDESNSRNDAPLLNEGTLPGNLTQGDVDFFKFIVAEPSVLSAALNTATLAQAWIFDEDGNEIYSPNGADPFDFEEILQPGTYYIALTGSNETEAGRYSLSFASRGIILARPDLTIGKSPSSQKGAGLYSASGTGQQFVAKSKKGRKVRSFFTVGNTGDVDGSLGIRGSGGNKYYKLKYLSYGGVGNITASVKRGGFRSQYIANKSILYRLDLKPTKSGKDRRKTGKFSIDSTGEGGADRGKVKVKILKK